MAQPEKIKTAIQSVIQEMMDRVLNRVLVEDPFIAETHKAKRPLYSALVPDEIFRGAHFERRFVTPFGKVWERLAVVAAGEGIGYGTLGHRITGNIRTGRLRRIQQVLDSLEHPRPGKQRVKPDWNKELKRIMKGGGQLVPTTVVCDIYAEDKGKKKKYAFELKAPLPNSDQTKVSKEKILKLYCMEPRHIDEAYYALPYNPYGERKDYAWSFPGRWFDMRGDTVVLIGEEFWNKIGGLGTYESFIDAINDIAPKYRQRIYKEYLGIEPPIEESQETAGRL